MLWDIAERPGPAQLENGGGNGVLVLDVAAVAAAMSGFLLTWGFKHEKDGAPVKTDSIAVLLVAPFMKSSGDRKFKVLL